MQGSGIESNILWKWIHAIVIGHVPFVGITLPLLILSSRYCVRGEISFLFLTYLRIRNDLLLDKGNWIPKWHSLFCSRIVLFKKTLGIFNFTSQMFDWIRAFSWKKYWVKAARLLKLIFSVKHIMLLCWLKQDSFHFRKWLKQCIPDSVVVQFLKCKQSYLFYIMKAKFLWVTLCRHSKMCNSKFIFGSL